MEQNEQTTPVPEQTPSSEPTTTQPESVAPQDESTQAQPAPEPAPPTPVSPPTPEPQPVPTAVETPVEYVLPEGVPPQMAEFARSQGFTQEQLDASIQQFGAYRQASDTLQMQALRQQGEEHIKSWGEEGEYKLNIARRALNQNDPDGVMTQLLNETGFGNHPKVLDFLYRIGNFMREGGFLKSAPTGPASKKSLAQSMYPNHPSKET